MKKKIIRILSLCYALSCLCIAPCFANENTQTLSQKQQSIIPIAAFTANGDTERLKAALVQGLENGMTVNEIKEVLIQMYAYSGFPRCLTGLNTFLAVLDERKEQGIWDETGKDASPLPEHADIREIGAANQTKIIGRPASGRIYEFAPVIDTFLKEHLFGDIFSRDILTFQERELATVSALASLPAETQLRSHLNCCFVAGLTEAQLKEFVSVLNEKVGKTEAKIAENALNTVIENRKQNN